MSGDWPTVQLGTLAADWDGAVAIGPFGSSMKAETYVEVGVPVIRGTNISRGRELCGEWVYVAEEFVDAMPRCIVREGDLVFPHRGAVGEAALVPGDRQRYFISTSCMKITIDRTRSDPRYVAYYFKSDAGRAEILRVASQVGTPGIGQPLTSLRQFRIPAPPLFVQSAIADLLSVLDDKIELNRHMAETLEATAQALFKNWFVDFDPVRAKIDDRVTRLPDDLAALFPARLADDGLPDGWKSRRLGDLVELAYGKALPKEVRRTGDIPVYGSGGENGFHDERLVSGPGIVVGRKGTVGSLFWVPTDFFPIDTVFYVKARRAESLDYIWHLLHILGLSLMNTDAAVPGLNRDNAYRLVVTDPGPALVQAFTSCAEVIRTRRENLFDENTTLIALRDAILPKLISGELRIRDAEHTVMAVA